MKAVQFTRFGPPDVLEVVELPVPEPGPGEVLIRVHAAGVNFFEVLMRADRYAVTPDLPMFPGVEIAGTVERAGPGLIHRLSVRGSPFLSLRSGAVRAVMPNSSRSTAGRWCNYRMRFLSRRLRR